jgi:hypothetical protein
MPSQKNLGLRMGGVSSAVFAAHGVFLGNGFYSIMYPSSMANLKGTSLNETPKAFFKTQGASVFTLPRQREADWLTTSISQPPLSCFGVMLPYLILSETCSQHDIFFVHLSCG